MRSRGGGRCRGAWLPKLSVTPQCVNDVVGFCNKYTCIRIKINDKIFFSRDEVFKVPLHISVFGVWFPSSVTWVVKGLVPFLGNGY